MKISQAMKLGLDNLLMNCMGVHEGDSLTVVREQGRHDYYSATLVETVAAYARMRDLRVDVIASPLLEHSAPVPTSIADAIKGSDHVLFVSRVGDQLRFGQNNGHGTRTMCYALNEQSFCTEFCSADYRFFVELKQLVNAAIWNEKEITITCPAGTHLVGTSPVGSGGEHDDVTLLRFPMTVFRPVPAETFSGTLAISRWLCLTGSNFYRPDSAIVDGVVHARIEKGRIIRFDGDPRDVRIVEQHYAFVAEKYGLDRDFVHSWHAGFHPQNGYDGAAIDNLVRWSGTVFGNPRYLHAHTCGNYAPGEICVSVFDPTITVGASDLWRRGEFVFARTPEVQELMNRYTGIRELFDHPVKDIGLGEG